MELRVLRYFLAIAREENMTKAASVLHLTQPTLSRQIHQLPFRGRFTNSNRNWERHCLSAMDIIFS